MKRSRPLSRLLLGYLVRTGLACAATAVLWFGVLMAMIQLGFVLPAYSGSDAALRAMELLPQMSADHFDADALPDLCRWVLLDESVAPDEAAAPENVLATNMDGASLDLALARGTRPLYSQFYRDVPLIDGTLCRLQYDFAMPYADPALRGVLPDFQACMTVLLVLLLAGVVFATTRRTARRLRAITGRLTDACRLLAGGDLEAPMPAPTHVREFDEALQTMDGLRGELAGSLKAQWAMEQQRAQRMAALTHDLKTPLTIIQGNAELLPSAPPWTPSCAGPGARGNIWPRCGTYARRSPPRPPARNSRCGPSAKNWPPPAKPSARPAGCGSPGRTTCPGHAHCRPGSRTWPAVWRTCWPTPPALRPGTGWSRWPAARRAGRSFLPWRMTGRVSRRRSCAAAAGRSPPGTPPAATAIRAWGFTGPARWPRPTAAG